MNLSNLRIFSVNIKDYLIDIVLILVWGIPTNAFVQWIYFTYLHKLWPLFDISPLSLDAIKIILWVVSYLILKSGLKWVTSQISFSKYTFNTTGKDKLTKQRFIREWFFQGNPQIENNELLVSNSNSGCLIKPLPIVGVLRNWKNFIAEFEVSFPSQKIPFTDYFGVIFRAQNFEDYLMAEFALENNILSLRPHIRFGGDWDAPILNINKNRLSTNSNAFRIKMVAKNENVLIYINGKQEFDWIIPTHVEPWMKQHAKKDGDGVSKTIIPELYLRNLSGMFGFRCYGNQRVLIRSLKIYPN